MTKCHLLAIGLLTIGAVALVVWPVVFIGNQPDFTEEQFEQLKEGMTREDVTALMQVPAGNHALFGSGEYRRIDGWQTIDGMGIPTDLGDTWCGRRGMIQVGFDKNERLVSKYYWHAWPPSPELKKRMTDALPQDWK